MCGVPTFGLSRQHSGHAADSESMLPEMYDNFSYEVILNSGHWIAEENPAEFAKSILKFFEKYLIPY